MRHRSRSNILFVSSFAIVTAACTSGPARKSAVTSPPKAIEAGIDNAALLAQLEPALIGSMQISGAAVSLQDAQVARVPRTPSRRTEGGLIVVDGISADGRTSTSVAVPDQRLNAEEQGGLVRLTEQQIAFALPLTERIDHLLVRLPEGGTPSTLDVREVFVRYCRGGDADPLCKPEKSSPGKAR